MPEESPGIIRATLSSLAKLLSVEDDQIEDALASEKLAKRQLSRRGIFIAGAAAVAAVALPTGLVLSPAAELTDNSVIVLRRIVLKMESNWDSSGQVMEWNYVHSDGSRIRVGAMQA